MAGKFKCLSCEKISTAEDIDNHTINNCCANRGQRRMFVSISKVGKFDRKWYQCPICGVNAYRRNFEKVEED